MKRNRWRGDKTMLFLNTQCHFLCFMFWGNIQLGLAFHSLKLTLCAQVANFFISPPQGLFKVARKFDNPSLKFPFLMERSIFGKWPPTIKRVLKLWRSTLTLARIGCHNYAKQTFLKQRPSLFFLVLSFVGLGVKVNWASVAFMSFKFLCVMEWSRFAIVQHKKAPICPRKSKLKKTKTNLTNVRRRKLWHICFQTLGVKVNQG